MKTFDFSLKFYFFTNFITFLIFLIATLLLRPSPSTRLQTTSISRTFKLHHHHLAAGAAAAATNHFRWVAFHRRGPRFLSLVPAGHMSRYGSARTFPFYLPERPLRIQNSRSTSAASCPILVKILSKMPKVGNRSINIIK